MSSRNNQKGHSCILFEGEEQFRNSIGPFILDGVKNNEKIAFLYCVHDITRMGSLLKEENDRLGYEINIDAVGFIKK